MECEYQLFILTLPKMKKQSFSLLMAILFVTLIFQACEQEFITVEKAQEDTIAPEIMLYSPVDGMIYDRGEDILIEMDVIENFKLHDVYIEVIPEGETSHIWDYYWHTHLKNVEIRELISANELEKGSYQLLVESFDHEYNICKEVRTFSIN